MRGRTQYGPGALALADGDAGPLDRAELLIEQARVELAPLRS